MEAAALLRMRGRSIPQIAESLGIAEDAARTLVATALNNAASGMDLATRQSLVALETSRLDALMDSHWDAATVGVDHRSADVVLKTIDRRAKLTGIDTPADTDTVTSATVVVAGDSSDYIEALRAITGGGTDG